jgi:hypothetical protein
MMKAQKPSGSGCPRSPSWLRWKALFEEPGATDLSVAHKAGTSVAYAADRRRATLGPRFVCRRTSELSEDNIAELLAAHLARIPKKIMAERFGFSSRTLEFLAVRYGFPRLRKPKVPRSRPGNLCRDPV